MTTTFSADKSRKEQRFFGIGSNDRVTVALPAASRTAAVKPKAVNRLEAFLGLRKRFGVIRVEVMPRYRRFDP